MTNFDSVRGSVDALLDTFIASVGTIIQRDDAEAKKGKEGIDGCAGGDVERLEADATRLKEALHAEKTKPRDVWNANFRSDTEKPGRLNQTDADWQTVATAFEGLLTRVAEIQTQTHWRGSGADAYMKELPYQQQALDELLYFTQQERQELANVALVMQATLLAIESKFRALDSRLYAIESSAAPADIYYKRTVDATAAFKTVNSWMTDVKNGATWKDAVAELKSSHANSLTALHMFANTDAWPSATTEGVASPADAPTNRPQASPTLPPDTSGQADPGLGQVRGGPGLAIDDYR